LAERKERQRRDEICLGDEEALSLKE
jgi:hypothetical protein